MAMATKAKAGQGIKILVVDDEAGMREMLTLLLEQAGYEVHCAGDGAHAMALLGHTQVDLVLCDMRMPQVDGLAFLAQLKSALLPMPVVMMSAFVDIDRAIEALTGGAADYVSKPFKKEEILLKIRLVLERQRLEEEAQRLKHENEMLRAQSGGVATETDMIGQCRSLRRVLEMVQKVATYRSTVLVLGESGTGKELIARAIHKASDRKDKAFVAVNCGAIPEALMESEFFGHVKGAFTDAHRDRQGFFERAEGGTLFLDEIGDLPLSMQVKFLRVLQENEIRAVGAEKVRNIDVRVVAATAKPLKEMVDAGSFREDLYYRLNVIQIDLPPLRQRKDDIPLLVEHFLRKYQDAVGERQPKVEPAAMKALLSYDWPGNIRELENCVERAMVLCDGELIRVDNLPERVQGAKGSSQGDVLGDELSIKKVTRSIEEILIRKSLEQTGGNRTHAAVLLEISHRALLYKIKEYGIE